MAASIASFRLARDVDAAIGHASTLLDKITPNLDAKHAKGKRFIIKTKNNSPRNRYIQSAVLNGQPPQSLLVE